MSRLVCGRLTLGKHNFILYFCLSNIASTWGWWLVCLVTPLYPTLCLSLDCSPPGFSVHGISQARTLSSFRGSSKPRDRTRVSCIGGGFLTHWVTRETPVLVTAFYQTRLLSHITSFSFALVTLSSFMKEGKSESHSVVSTTPWTATAFSKAFLSVEFSRQEYWSGLSFPSPGESNLGLLHCRWTQTTVWATREAFMDIAK